ncbi:MAG: hypothetical protein AAGK04_05165 [Planctomycetota bacterium]
MPVKEISNMMQDNSWLLIASIVGLVFIFGAIADALRKSAQSRHRERTRRELFAYVAEGSISPDDAQALLNATAKKPDWQKKVAEMVEWGSISPDDAAKLCDAFERGATKASEAVRKGVNAHVNATNSKAPQP